MIREENIFKLRCQNLYTEKLFEYDKKTKSLERRGSVCWKFPLFKTLKLTPDFHSDEELIYLLM